MKKIFIALICCQILIPGILSAKETLENITLTEEELTIKKATSDQQIESRLKKIFDITGWYPNLKIEVNEGIVILSGSIDTMEHTQWALKLIEKTEGVIAVVDKLERSLSQQSVLNPASEEASNLYKKAYKQVPYIVSGFFILILFIFFSFLAYQMTKVSLSRKNSNLLLVKTIANIVGFIILILGFYLALKSSGLSTLAVSLLGGTGMLGLGIGLALKSTFENYASSIMISLKDLLKMGEIVNINGFEGVVQSVTTRGTTLMDYEGNNIIIPNSQVFNSVIKNLTRNPKMRTDFTVGIGYEDSIDKARAVVLKALNELFPNVLKDPEPIVAVHELGAATVNLKIYFWFNATEFSLIKLKSLVIQKIKEALVEAEVSLPDDAREVVFANPLKIENLTTAQVTDKPKEPKPTAPLPITQDLKNEVEEIKEQAAKMAPIEKGENLI